jgi:hypothetical protein
MSCISGMFLQGQSNAAAQAVAGAVSQGEHRPDGTIEKFTIKPRRHYLVSFESVSE